MSSARGFDSEQVGWIPDADEALGQLADAELRVLGLISNASNTTLLCQLGEATDELYAVYKPGEGERPLWDFPDGLYQREVATYEVSRFLGWDIIPPTVLRDGDHGPGSLQLFVPHDPSQHYFELIRDDDHDRALAQLAMFDLVVNNADRKGGHVLHGSKDGRIWGIDNGLTFHVQSKLRTVMWELDHVVLDDSWRDDLRRLAEALRDPSGSLICERLADLLLASEIDLLSRRAEIVAGLSRLPSLPEDERPYPWPPL